MILILSGPGDTHAGKVQAELRRRGIAAGRLDPATFPGLSGIGLSLSGSGTLDGAVGPYGGPVQLEDVRAVYCGKPTSPASNSILDELWEALDVGVIPGSAPVVERAFDLERQRYFAAKAGFEIFDDGANIDSYVTRLRVVVVGYRVFAASLGFATVEPLSLNMWDACIDRDGISPAVLPVALAEQCREMVEQIGLEFATLDIAINSDGKALFCGLNPFGHFACIEDATGLPITRAVVDLLLTEAGSAIASKHAATRPAPTRTHPSKNQRHVPFLRVARGRQ